MTSKMKAKYRAQFCEDIQTLYNSQTAESSYPQDVAMEDRITGAIMGVFIGDALGNGSLWNYDYNRLWNHYGTWITDYQDPYHEAAEVPMETISQYKYDYGVRAGYSSQSGQLLQILLETVVKNIKEPCDGMGFQPEEYVKNINAFFEYELLPYASFEKNTNERVKFFVGNGIKCYSGRYTDKAVRENFDVWYNDGQKNGKWWENDQVSRTSTSEGAQWLTVLAGLYRLPQDFFYAAKTLLEMWYTEKAFNSLAIVYGMTIQAIINGISLDDLMDYMQETVYAMGELGKTITSTDDLVSNTKMLNMLEKPQLFRFDDRFAPLIFGQDCHIANLLPCAYYYAFKYSDDFEQAVLVATNSSGNNMARAALVGGLVGAMVGVQGIPKRFIDGLRTEPRLLAEKYTSHGQYLLDLAKIVAQSCCGKAAEFKNPFAEARKQEKEYR